MMRTRYVSLVLVWIALALALVSPVRADPSTGCEANTLVSLEHCVHHAIESGDIDNAGIAKSLLAKIDAAKAALDRQQVGVAVRTLEAFINEVEAQAGNHIDAVHAQHMVMHAERVIDALVP